MRRAITVFALLLALGGSIAVPGASAAGNGSTATERLQTLDREVLVLLNTRRTAHGLRPLTNSDDLRNAAVAHSRAMLEGGFFAHVSSDGSPFSARVRGFYPSTGYDSWSAGENLLYSTSKIQATTAIDAWLASPAHRRNMLDPEWREVGIASLHAQVAGGTFGGDSTWVITMDFGARSGKTTTKPKPPTTPARDG